MISGRPVCSIFVIAMLAACMLAGCGGGSSPSSRRISSGSPSGEAPSYRISEKVNWGREITLDEIIAMAKGGQIEEIEWHVMPNILRAQASGGRIFHLRNENKGIDLRNKLLNAGVRIGNGGIIFRHVF